MNAVLSMLSKVEFSAEVVEMDEKAGTATIVAHVGYYDSEALMAAAENKIMELAQTMDPAVLNTEEGIMQLLKDYLAQYAKIVEELEPVEGTKDFEVPFVLKEMKINGKTKDVWLPEDVMQFGMDVSTHIMGN